MAFERFIARRFMPRKGGEGSFSGPLSAIAVTAIALGVVVMVMAVSILRGFQSDISDKVAGFGGHITVDAYSTGYAYAETPVTYDTLLAGQLASTQGVAHVYRFATAGGMVKTADQIHAILLRGFGSDYDTAFFASCLTEGRLPAFGSGTPDVMVSSTIAARLRIKVGDKLRSYFWQGDNYRSRAFSVCGIYNTDLKEMDELCVVGDLAQVQRLHGWDTGQVGGLEVLVDDFDDLDAVARRVATLLPFDLRLQTIVQRNPALFSWLDLLNANIALILAIMCLVSAVAIVSALLIMIFEKSATIGLLKSLGATSASIRRIFLLKAARLVAAGIAIGDAVALALSLIQTTWQPLSLNPESYSMTHVPVEINPWVYAAVSVGTLAVCIAALLLPTAYVSRISPARTMRIEN